MINVALDSNWNKLNLKYSKYLKLKLKLKIIMLKHLKKTKSYNKMTKTWTKINI